MANTLEVAQDALGRARGGQSFANYPAIFAGFMAKWIPEDDIMPRENVLTFAAWRALGRTVRKGEHGVKVFTFVPVPDRKMTDAATGAETIRKGGTVPKGTTVFHVSQTELIGGGS